MKSDARHLRWLPAALLLALVTAPPARAADRAFAVGVNATGNCRFQAAAVSLAFGNLDPTSGRDVAADASITFKCTKGATWEVADGGGLYDAAGAHRMRHASSPVYLPYALSFANATGTSEGASIQQTLGISGLIRGADYADLPQGSYTDTVTITIGP